jgi:hypothetical protein
LSPEGGILTTRNTKGTKYPDSAGHCFGFYVVSPILSWEIERKGIKERGGFKRLTTTTEGSEDPDVTTECTEGTEGTESGPSANSAHSVVNLSGDSVDISHSGFTATESSEVPSLRSLYFMVSPFFASVRGGYRNWKRDATAPSLRTVW